MHSIYNRLRTKPLDITRGPTPVVTGKRSFLVVDTDTGTALPSSRSMARRNSAAASRLSPCSMDSSTRRSR